MRFNNELLFGIVEQDEKMQDDNYYPVVRFKLAFNLGKKRIIQDLLLGGYSKRNFYIKDNVLYLEAEYDIQQWMFITAKVIFTDKTVISCLLSINFTNAGKLLGYSIRMID